MKGLIIELLDPAVIPEHSASTAAASSLGYIPGATLLGAAAGTLYDDLSSEQAFEIFHSGSTIFNDALPLTKDGAIGWPAPLSLHARKGERFECGGVLADGVADRALPEAREGQWKQSPGTALSRDSRLVATPRQITTRTAINPESGRAAKAQLFTYEALAPGARFFSTIRSEYSEKICTALTNGYIFLGRSRAAEFGRARVALCDAPEWPASTRQSGDVYLWCLSDAWLTDANGFPTVTPDPASFGINQGEIDWNRSFIRTRRYIPYNAAWRCRGLERVVIERGSVLTIKDAGATKTGLHRFGLAQEQGLGAVFISSHSPKRALADLPDAVSHTPADQPDANDVALADHPDAVSLPPKPDQPGSTPLSLVKWLNERVAASATPPSRPPEALVKDLLELYRKAEEWNSDPFIGPTPTQWGVVRVALRRADRKQVKEQLFGENGVTRGDDKNRKSWNVRFATGKQGTFSGWLCARLEETGPEAMSVVARDIRDALRRRGP